MLPEVDSSEVMAPNIREQVVNQTDVRMHRVASLAISIRLDRSFSAEPRHHDGDTHRLSPGPTREERVYGAGCIDHSTATSLVGPKLPS